ncbi:MAG: ribose 5-phosphate isomerase B [Armatimonadota bacterium]
MKVALGCDHAGRPLMAHLKSWLEGRGHTCIDHGAYDDQPSDYPDYARVVGESVARGEVDTGVLVCGTGIGMSLAANKVPGVYAAVCHDEYSAAMARAHNHANVLTLGARVVGPGLAEGIMETWLSTEFDQDERHRRRLRKLKDIEAQCGSKES